MGKKGEEIIRLERKVLRWHRAAWFLAAALSCDGGGGGMAWGCCYPISAQSPPPQRERVRKGTGITMGMGMGGR